MTDDLEEEISALEAEAVVGSVDEAEPIELEEVPDADVAEPPEDWQAHAHDDEYLEDPFVEVGSINGFSTGSFAKVGAANFKVPGTNIVLPVRREVAPLLIGAADEFNRRVERLVPGWNWGHANRTVRGASVPSFHSAAIAIDLNAPRHPLGKRGTFSKSQATTIRAIARKYGLRWGGDYRSRADEMHLEVILPRAQALALVRRLQSAPASKPAPAKPAPKAGKAPAFPLPKGFSFGPRSGPAHIISGYYSHRADLRRWQQRMKDRGWKTLDVDGLYGPNTASVTREFQRRKKMNPNGLIGPMTWEAAWTLPPG